MLAKDALEAHQIVMNQTTPLNQMAGIIGSANEFCKVKNCFINYQKHVRTKAEDFLMHKHNKRLELAENCTQLVESLEKKFNTDKVQMLKEQRRRIQEKEEVI